MINLIWDLDGTLIDSMPIIAGSLAATAQHYGIEPWPQERVQQMIGPELGLILKEMLALETDAQVSQAKEIYRTHYRQTMTESPLFAGLEQVLKDFKQTGVTLYVATAKYQLFAQQILEANGIAKLFSGIYGSNEDGSLGNKTELLAHLLAEEGLNAAQCLMIGDTQYDIQAGRNHNMTTLAVDWGYGSKADLTGAGAHFYAQQVADLPELVKKAMTCGC